MNNNMLKLILLLSVNLFNGVVFSQDKLSVSTTIKQMPQMDATQIVARANQAAYYSGSDGRSDARMKVVDSQGRVQFRQFVILRKNREEGGDQDFLVVFSRPSDIRDTVFLVNKHLGKDDDRWIYLPAFDLVKRISAGDKRTSFVGSHFYYEDVSGRFPGDDIHELLGSDGSRFQLKHTPKDPETVEFAYFTSDIDKETFLPMKVQYFNSKGTLIRSLEVKKVEKIKGIPTVTESKMTDHLSQSFTLMQFRFIDYSIGLPDDLFTERSLRSPPVNWLKAQ